MPEGSSPSIALCGFMASGKTTLGRMLAERLERRFIDLDGEIATELGHPIPVIFEQQGETTFREVESRLCRELSETPGQVVALGGGALLDDDSRRAWERNGILIALDVSHGELIERLRDEDPTQRPLLDGAVEELESRTKDLLLQRQPTLDGILHRVQADDAPGDVLERLVDCVHEIEVLSRSAGPDATCLPIRSPTGTYPVWIGEGHALALPLLLKSQGLSPGRVVLVHDAALDAEAQSLCGALAEAGFLPTAVPLAGGEARKTLAAVAPIWAACAEVGLTRDRPIIALGGGVVGDLAGFAAATYMRGVPIVHLPTTLLSCVDSALGGKTGCDLPQGKNLVGAFHHPAAVLVDATYLKTLPAEEYRAGMAEVIKHGLLEGGELMSRLIDGAFEASPKDLALAITVKAEVVQEDPGERGRRALLNLGHTFAHAIESVSGYTWRHGDAVAVGLLAATRLSFELGLCEAGLLDQVKTLLEREQLPTRAPGFEVADLRKAMDRDKKKTGAALRLVVLREAGRAELLSAPPEDALTAAWESVL